MFGWIIASPLIDWIDESYVMVVVIFSLVAFFVVTILWFGASFEISLFSLRRKLYLENITTAGKTRILENIEVFEKLPSPMRGLLIFWKKRPTLMELENALYEIQNIPELATSVWKKPLEALTKNKNRAKPKSIDRYLNGLLQTDWQTRFVARHMLIH